MTTDQTLLNELQYAATETPNLGASWPSGLWTPDELSGYLNQRQRRLLYETGCICTRSGPIPTTQNVQRYNLPTDWIQTRRVVWTDANHTPHPLLRAAVWYLDYGLTSWEAIMSPVPLVFLDDVTPTLEMLIAPAASDDGILNLLYVQLGATLGHSGASLTIPDDLVPILKWGVLADLFGKVGRAHDPTRAQYAEDRFSLGIELVGGLLWGGQDPQA